VTLRCSAGCCTQVSMLQCTLNVDVLLFAGNKGLDVATPEMSLESMSAQQFPSYLQAEGGGWRQHGGRQSGTVAR
jgi:hypothetical protein